MLSQGIAMQVRSVSFNHEPVSYTHLKKTEFSEAVSGALDKSRIMKDVEMFCRLDRYTGSRDGEEAAERIAERMEELGIPVEREKYQVYRSLPGAAYLLSLIHICFVMWPIRTAVSGKQMTPAGATEIMEVLGKEESLERIRKGIALLEA